MWSYRFYDRFWSPSFPFSFSFFDIVSFGSRVCAAQNADDKIVWMRATNDFFFLFTRSISFVPRYEKTPKSTLGGAYKFLCWGIIKFARACLLLHLFYACTACFNVVDNGQLNLGNEIGAFDQWTRKVSIITQEMLLWTNIEFSELLNGAFYHKNWNIIFVLKSESFFEKWELQVINGMQRKAFNFCYYKNTF